MFNLIPVVMLLLMQGVGAEGLSLRQQQALLDLAYRVQAVQNEGELKQALISEAGVSSADLSFWIQVFSTATPSSHDQEVGRHAFSNEPVLPQGNAGKACPGWSASSRTRDGPSAL